MFVLLLWLQLVLGSDIILERNINGKNGYMAIIDAGSSGSRTFLFGKYPNGYQALNGMVQWREVRPGLHSNEMNQYEHVKTCLAFVRDYVPQNKYEDTDIYLFATGGMRSLNRSKYVLDEVFKKASLDMSMFRFKRERFRVISGKEEGFYLMLGINYLLRSIGPHLRPGLSSMAGGLDLGGKSTQIVYDEMERWKMMHGRKNRVRKRPLSLLSVNDFHAPSYMEYGVNAMYGKLNRSADIKDCLFLNDTRGGTGNMTNCMVHLENLIEMDNADCPADKYCALNSIPHDAVKGDVFYAVSVYAIAIEFIKDTLMNKDIHKYVNDLQIGHFNEPNPSISEIELAGTSICNVNIDVMLKWNRAKQTSSQQLYRRCFDIAYIVVLLKRYQFPIDRRNIYFMDHIGDVPLTWTIGAYLHLFEQYLDKKLQQEYYVSLEKYQQGLPIARNLCILLFILAIYYLYKQVQSTRHHTIKSFKFIHDCSE